MSSAAYASCEVLIFCHSSVSYGMRCRLLQRNIGVHLAVYVKLEHALVLFHRYFLACLLKMIHIGEVLFFVLLVSGLDNN